MTFMVEVEGYQGTIARLLQQIQGHERDILDVPLSPIVGSFVATLTDHRELLSLDQISEFLLVAAILIEMKSTKLLPGPDEVDDDEELIGLESRDLLLARLLECRAYAGAADAFVLLDELASRSVPREAGLEDDFTVEAPDLLAGVTHEQLADAFKRTLVEPDIARVDLSHVHVDTVTVAAMVMELAQSLPKQGRTTFRSMVEGLTTRLEIIVHFLAVLELCKLGRVLLGQGISFGDLEIEWIGADSDGDLLMTAEGVIDSYEG